MDLILEIRTGRECVTMACQGKLIGGKEADAFRRSALLLLGGFEKININLAGVRMVDCGGLGSLARVLEMAAEQGKTVRIMHATRLIAEQLRLAGLEAFMENSQMPRPRLVGTGREAVA
jgi:anti-anti-sigma factor